jgi:hypothetical protein
MKCTKCRAPMLFAGKRRIGKPLLVGKFRRKVSKTCISLCGEEREERDIG